jgi:hypothetical protein
LIYFQYAKRSRRSQKLMLDCERRGDKDLLLFVLWLDVEDGEWTSLGPICHGPRGMQDKFQCRQSMYANSAKRIAETGFTQVNFIAHGII